MRIGVNALYLIPGSVGGTEIYLRNLLQALTSIDQKNEYVVFANRETGHDLPSCVVLPINAVNRPARMIYEQTGLASQARKHRIDVMFNPGFTAPAFPGCPNVTVFHDLQHKRHPEHFRWFDLPAWEFFLWLSIKRSAVIIADSDTTRTDLKRYYGKDSTVVPLGVEPEFYRIAERREPKDFYLCVSTLHPHKNLTNLLRAISTTRDKLIITGVRGFHTEIIEQLIQELNLKDRVQLTGWVPRAELYELFRTAKAMIYPSTFEGFGLPVIEAMAAGLPLACSNIEPLHSIVSGAAIEFPPDDMDAILAAIRRLDQMDTNKGRQRAALFTWEETARKTLEAIEAGLRAGSSRRS